MPTGSEIVAKELRRRGVDTVFELVGGMITHLLDTFHRDGSIRIVSMHHEQAAAFAADGYARMKGVPGVALATSGPGATNLLTGIASCYFDSTPGVFVCGQVNRNELKRDRPIRQLGFQETDIVSMVAPITKAAWLVEDPDQIPDLVARAFDIATSGRPGPVLLDIPMDVQRAEVRSRPSGSPQTPRSPDDGVSPAIDGVHVDEMLSTLGRARRPLVLVGGGVRAGSAVAGVRRLVGSLGVPVVNSLMGVDVLPATDPLRVGMIGTYGNRWANIALARADWLLVLGSRLDIRQTGADVNAFREGKTIFHVDCDPGEINGRISGCIAVVRDLASFVEEVTPHVVGLESHGEWLHEIRALREQWPDTAEAVGGAGINPNELMHQLSAAAGEAAAFVADVGQHQMWAAQSLELGDGQRFITSGGLGSMGFGLPAAIGASFAMAGCPIVVIAGDGGFQLNIQELQTVVRNSLPLKIVILNNGTHGMVRQFQETYFHGRYQSTVWGYSAPDFAAVAGAYGIWARRVARTDEVDDCMRELMAVPGPALLEVAVPLETNVYPKMAFGRPMSEMEPFASPIAMEGT